MSKISAYVIYFILFMAIAMVLTLLAISILNDTNKAPAGDDTLVDLSQMAKDVALKDEGLASLIGNRTYTVPGGIVWNETFVQHYYALDSKIYDVAVNVTGEKVIYISEVTDPSVISWLSNISVSGTALKDNRGKIIFTHDTVLNDSINAEIVRIALSDPGLKMLLGNQSYRVSPVTLTDFERNFPDPVKGTFPSVSIYLGNMTVFDETYTAIVDYNERKVVGIMHSYPDPWPFPK